MKFESSDEGSITRNHLRHSSKGTLASLLSHRILSMRDAKFPSEADRIPGEEFRASFAHTRGIRLKTLKSPPRVRQVRPPR